MIWLPTTAQVIRLHGKLIARTGGSDGVRDAGLVESAVMRAMAEYSGVEAYPTIPEKAAAVCCGLIQNHGFIDGNKRIGVATMLLILRKNGVVLRYAQEELVRLGLDAAQSRLSVEDVAEWIRKRTPED